MYDDNSCYRNNFNCWKCCEKRTNKTNRTLVGDIEDAYEISEDGDKEYYTSLVLRVPKLDNYKKSILRMYGNPGEAYPVTLITDYYGEDMFKQSRE